ncbi:MAG: hypothetical protein GY835_13030 [bacterium]|nr:hypothetical protein [bacterium]
MGKKKKRRKLKTRTIWILLSSYMIVGVVVALFVLNNHTSDPVQTEAGQQAASGAGTVFPLIVMLWPIFVVIHLIRILF